MAAGFYNPKKRLHEAHPAMDALSQKAKTQLTQVEDELAKREARGEDTSYARAVYYEVEWRVGCTSDLDAARDAIDRMEAALSCKNPPTALTQDHDGAFAVGINVFFLQLDRSTDQLLGRQWPWRRPPAFLDPINDPVRMVTYLQDLTWSDVVRCGRDDRKEMNLAISVIARLVMRGGQAGYMNAPGFIPAFERFVRDWQDPKTGFFGMNYILEDGSAIRTNDLSLTFHIARYVPHLIRWWPLLIDTLLDMRADEYPQGWLQDQKMTDHNNYDVAELFYRAWPYMRADQRRAASDAVAQMFDWCIPHSVGLDGVLANPDKGDPIADSYYFAAAFLDTVGFFNPGKKFWTAATLPDCTAIRNGMAAQLRTFNSYYTGVDDALARLGVATHPWTDAVL